MKKKLSLIFLVLFCFSLGGYFNRDVLNDAWAAIQSQVGINSLSGSTWKPLTNITPGGATSTPNAIVTGIATWNPISSTWNVVPALPTNTTNITPTAGSATRTLAGSNIPVFFSLNMMRSSGNPDTTGWTQTSNADETAGLSTGNGIAAFMYAKCNNGNVGRSIAQSLQDGMSSASCSPSDGSYVPAFNPAVFNGGSWDRRRGVSTNTLTATTSLGANVTVPLSTWSCTHSPAATTQATCSKAAGGGTVRHVATTLTACYASDVAVGAFAREIDLRDGATGAGTIKWSALLSMPTANDSRCITQTGLAIIGTANTAMTLEFASAGNAGSIETVTLTGFSVP